MDKDYNKANIKDLLYSINDFKNYLFGEERYSILSTKQPKDRPSSLGELKGKAKQFSKDSISLLREEALSCTCCSLSASRHSVVFGSGDIDSPIMLIGEAPGAKEDEMGEPFVGRAGILLDKMFGAINLSRDNLYICNVLKCRPPSNRNPKEDEIEACSHFLASQIDMIKPFIIVSLGNFATRYILKTKEGISKLRGMVHEKDKYKVFPMFHPSALLQNPNLKKPTWEDLKHLKRLLIEANMEYLFTKD